MWRRFEKIPLIPLCAAGFLLGAILCFWRGNAGDFLSEEKLCGIKEAMLEEGSQPQNGSFLYDVGKLRLKSTVLLVVAGTTYLAPFVCIATAVWSGMSVGVLFAGAMIKYGLKGILLLPATLFPQWGIYAPAFYLLLRWCEKLYAGIYQRKPLNRWGCLSRLILILLMMAAGVFLECFVNPKVLGGILKIL